jgi:hypothetical protein
LIHVFALSQRHFAKKQLRIILALRVKLNARTVIGTIRLPHAPVVSADLQEMAGGEARRVEP